MANTTQYAQLNIGRNVGDVPMDAATWAEFIREARVALAESVVDTDGMRSTWLYDNTQAHYGRGEWGGVAEDSAHVSLFAEQGMHVGNLKRWARDMAATYGQDAIALITGSELVTA